LLTEIINADSGLDEPHTVMIHQSSGDVYVVGYLSDNVYKITNPVNCSTGSDLDDCTITEIVNAASSRLDGPQTLVIHESSGDVYVTGSLGAHIVLKIDNPANCSTVDTDGTPICNTTEIMTGLFFLPYGLAIHESSGDVYVTDVFSSDIYKIINPVNCSAVDTDGTPICNTTKIMDKTSFIPWAIAIHQSSGDFYVAGIGVENNVLKIDTSVNCSAVDTDGTPICDITAIVVRGPGLNEPYGIAVHDSTGDIYVTGFSSNTILKITNPVNCSTVDTDGTPICDITEILNGDSGLDEPYGIAVHDSTGDVYVAGSKSNNVFKLTFTSAPLEEIESSGSGGCDNCEAPTLGINSKAKRMVQNGFTYNGIPTDVERFYTPYPLLTVNVGDKNTAIFKIYEDTGPQNIKHFAFAFGLGTDQIISNSKAMIELDIDHEGTETITVTDPENALENIDVSTNVDSCNGGSADSQCLIVTIDHTFRAPLDFNIVATDVWDMKRNSWQNYYNHGIEIEGESLNLPKQYNGISKGHIYHLTETSKTMAVDEFGNTWLFQYDVWMKDYIKNERVQDPHWSVMNRMHSDFADYKELQAQIAQEQLLELCDTCLESPFTGFTNSWAYEIPEAMTAEKRIKKISVLIEIEKNKALQILDDAVKSTKYH